jgi:hypothetical protein
MRSHNKPRWEAAVTGCCDMQRSERSKQVSLLKKQCELALPLQASTACRLRNLPKERAI